MPDAVFLIATLRRALQRRAVRRALVAMIAIGTALTVSSSLASVERARDRWGETTAVAVALQDLSPGEVVDPSAAAMEERPVSLLGEEALTALPTGATVRYPIEAGEPLVPTRLAPQGLTGVAALIPSGHRALAIPTTQLGAPPVSPGTRVDVVVVNPAAAAPTDPVPTDGTDATSRGAPARPLAASALVVAADDDAVTVAVPQHVAPQVAYALATTTVVLTLTPD